MKLLLRAIVKNLIRPLKKLVFVILAFYGLGNISGFGQTNMLDSLLVDSAELPIQYIEATFKATRIINGQSCETTPIGTLDFRIAHRFAPVNGGTYNLFGLDQASTKFSFDYGITKEFTVGVGRSTYEKTYDGFVKYKFLKQRESGFSPISAVWLSSMSINTLRWADPNRTNYFTSRLNFVHQLLVARKVNENFSFQLTPTLIHRNLVSTFDEDNDVLAIGIGLRQKLTKRTSINIEYFYPQRTSIQDRYKNSLSIGFDIETGGHVFQLHFTNSTAMIEKAFIAENTQSWKNAGFMFGFNISRVFTLKSYDYE